MLDMTTVGMNIRLRLTDMIAVTVRITNSTIRVTFGNWMDLKEKTLSLRACVARTRGVIVMIYEEESSGDSTVYNRDCAT